MHLSIKSLALSLILFSLTLIPTACQRETGPTKASPVPVLQPENDVNPFVGTAADGNTFPGATMPFGMIQWSPTSGFAEHAGGYVYGDNVIRGFGLNHLSGPGCPILGDVPIMPWVGAVTSSPAADKKAYSAKFSHANETASPGFYSVTLDNGVKAQLTVTTRAGIGRFSFPSSANSTFLFKTSQTANHNGVRTASIEISGNQKVSGSVSTGGFCSYPNKYTVYFAAEFHRPFSSFGTWQGSSVKKGGRSVRGSKTGGYVGFDTTNDRAVEMKVAISYVSVDNAWKNLKKEIPGWNFDSVRQGASDTWNHELSLITISGGTKEEDRVFYTALYHALLAPNVFNDVNGEYMGFDNHVHIAKGYTQYANYSGWDIYRDEIQLISLLHPKEASDMIQSLVVDEQQGGGLPMWPVANDEACQMVGNPSCPIIADAYAFGARNFDAHAALKAMLKGATQPGANCNGCQEWDSLSSYLKRGYLGPDDNGHKAGRKSGPSEMLEFTTADFSIAQMAKALGDITTYQTFMKRAQFWRNTFNTKSGYVEPRRDNGSFISVDPASHKYYVEGNAAQYSWMVPYNMRSLIDLMGGNQIVVERLNKFFTELNAGENRPYFWIGNEPVFAVPWAYDFAGAPWGAQDVVRRVEMEPYTSKPDGLPGNDDLGAMSAWYVFASLGAYPAIPGVGGFALDSPLFPKAVFHLGNGEVVTIEGENASAANPYVQSLKVNGRPSDRTWIPYDTFAQGATLQFKLGSTPNKAWGTKPDDAPPSFTEGMATHGE
jgi:predicted alpha-1,2-mannosidase